MRSCDDRAIYGVLSVRIVTNFFIEIHMVLCRMLPTMRLIGLGLLVLRCLLGQQDDLQSSKQACILMSVSDSRSRDQSSSAGINLTHTLLFIDRGFTASVFYCIWSWLLFDFVVQFSAGLSLCLPDV